MKYAVGSGCTTNWSKIKKQQSLGDNEIHDGDSVQIVFPFHLFLILVISCSICFCAELHGRSRWPHLHKCFFVIFLNVWIKMIVISSSSRGSPMITWGPPFLFSQKNPPFSPFSLHAPASRHRHEWWPRVQQARWLCHDASRGPVLHVYLLSPNVSVRHSAGGAVLVFRGRRERRGRSK